MVSVGEWQMRRESRLLITLRDKQAEAMNDVTDELRRKRLADNTRRWRERHPERNRAAQRASDAKPERKAKAAARVRKKRATDPSFREREKASKRRPEYLARQRERNKQPGNIERQRKYQRSEKGLAWHREHIKRHRQTPHGRLENRLRSAIRRGITSQIGSGCFRHLGYTVDELRWHLERQFLKGMSWRNADIWHIDHIIPLSHFRLKSLEDLNLRIAWGLTNLRPMWAVDNLAKGSRVINLL